MHDYITGIQQIGIGVTDVRESMLDYKKAFGMSTLIFDDVAEAKLMTKYTGGDVHKRRAALTMNLAGGGGFEIWQFISRTPKQHSAVPQYGDLGIFAPKIKSTDIHTAHTYLNNNTSYKTSGIQTAPDGSNHFWAADNNGNQFQITTGKHWFKKNGKETGGVCGAVIGVSDIEQALVLYRDILGIGDVIYDKVGAYEDNPQNEQQTCRRVLLRKGYRGKGSFGKLLGDIEIELVECKSRRPEKIYADRYWGDCGFIHLCFDVINMDGLKEEAKKNGYSFSVDSEQSFDMESAAGRFCYIEDKDGTLIELVETHKVPVFKKLQLYINLKKRNLEKPLPDWMINMLALSKVK